MADQSILRIAREIKQMRNETDLSIAVACHDSNVRRLSTLIIGPPDSPYQFGFFEFDIRFGKDYPANPPTVRAITTNGGKCRFNPNIYANGKVCLSILGTWAGERGEQWSSAQGLESILISIQSLLSANPYENEPGYENTKGSESQKEMAAYVAKIRHETLRIAVMHPLELSLGIRRDGSVVPRSTKKDEEELLLEEERTPDPFADLRKRRFLWYFESYMHSIDTAGQAITRTQFFERMPFENRGNTMDGHFDYTELKRRFALIWNTLMNETKSWAVEGLEVNKQEIGIAVSLRRQYEQIVEDLKRQKNFTVDLSLVDDNPFVWQLTYFGRPMTHLDGGIFKIRIHLSPRFPEEQPRVFMQTPLFHLRVSKHGVLCYCLERAEEMRHHVEAIVSALEDESPPYDPRMTVNAEASKLFWGSPDERKQYNRALRRSVERSAEEALA